MRFIDFTPNYSKHPTTPYTSDHFVYDGLQDIIDQIKTQLSKVIAIETYPGVDVDHILAILNQEFNHHRIIDVRTLSIDKETYLNLFKEDMTDDRVFGKKTTKSIADLFQNHDLFEWTEPAILVGFGSALFFHDLLYYVSITRYEHQLRMRDGQANYLLDNPQEDILTKYKNAYFIEWVIAHQHKLDIFHQIDYMIDWNDMKSPKMVAFEGYQKALETLTKKPFRLVPYFDPGVWGGQWMKEVFQLDPSIKNYAWSFDGVVEENSLKLLINDVLFEVPAQDIVDLFPVAILGPHVFEYFGYNLPIRFDLLDTMQGENLSLQVHPQPDYMKKHFNMPYTQDESYYILDAMEDGKVYLGFKNDLDIDAFETELKASKTSQQFDAEKYVNVFPVKKHDHLLIPSGTIHCSGRNTLVLEISAAAYIFTFKLWDWNRLGLDGKMRPVHLEHGLQNLDYRRTEDKILKEHINNVVKMDEHVEKTGLYHGTFLDAYRLSFTGPYHYRFLPTVQMANLVEGKGMIMYSPTQCFEPVEIHYAETFIIPAQIEDVIFECLDGTCKIIFSEVNPSWSKPSY